MSRVGAAPLWRDGLLAVLAGVAGGLSWQPYALWPMAFIAVAGLVLLTATAGMKRSAFIGYLFGLTQGVLAISWVSVLGWWVAGLLIAVMACWWALLGVALRIVRPVPGWPVWAAACWVLMEAAMSRFPVGGFPWLRLAWTSVDQPLRGWLPMVGSPAVGFLIALCGTSLAAVLIDRRGRARFAWLAVPVLLFSVGGVLAARPVPASGATVNIGSVQGNLDGNAGPQSMGYARSVTNNHLSETVTLMARARAGIDPMPDLVVWPENSTDIDPTKEAVTRSLVGDATALTQRPILVGAVMEGPGVNQRQTTSLWWSTSNQVQARYDKRNLVPFGEWIPWRDQLLPIFPILKEVGAQSVPGHGPGVLTGTLDDGRKLTVGTIVCFELAWDSTVYDTVRNGAQVVLVQSNNGTYTGTGQPRQQFAITRARAIELGREIVVTTTNSFSGEILADGRVVTRSTPTKAMARTYTVPTRTTITPAVRIGGRLELALSLVAAGSLLVAGGREIARRRAVRTGR